MRIAEFCSRNIADVAGNADAGIAKLCHTQDEAGQRIRGVWLVIQAGREGGMSVNPRLIATYDRLLPATACTCHGGRMCVVRFQQRDNPSRDVGLRSERPSTYSSRGTPLTHSIGRSRAAACSSTHRRASCGEEQTRVAGARPGESL